MNIFMRINFTKYAKDMRIKVAYKIGNNVWRFIIESGKSRIRVVQYCPSVWAYLLKTESNP